MVVSERQQPSMQPIPWEPAEVHLAEESKVGSHGRRSKPLGPTTAVGRTHGAGLGAE